jgi:hypothetical protein
MNNLTLDENTRLYEPTTRRAGARAYSPGELVRFDERDGAVQAGAVLRVESIDPEGAFVRLRRRSGELIDWAPKSSVQVFAPVIGEVKRGTVLEWSNDRSDLGVQSGDLALVVGVDPAQGVTVRSKKNGETQLHLEPGAWHYAVTKDGVVGHLREASQHRLEPYRDVDPTPEKPTHDRPFDELARPYSLVTHGAPPPLDVFSNGDVVYFAASRDQRIPENHVFTVQGVREGRLRLVDGRELSGDPSTTRDVWWRPSERDEVRLYTPATALAAQDLIAWRRDDPTLLIKRGTYSEVLEVRPRQVVVTGVTSTPEVLPVDRGRWAARWHPQNESWRLDRIPARERIRDVATQTRPLGLALGL